MLLGSSARRGQPPRSLELATDRPCALLVGNVVFMAHSEGYKGFQKAFSPRVAARTHYLAAHPHWLRTLFAPLFCMGFFHATRKRMIVSYTLTVVLVGVILAVRQLDQPWRGIIDAGVVVGLAWGLVAYWVFTARIFASDAYRPDPEVA